MRFRFLCAFVALFSFGALGSVGEKFSLGTRDQLQLQFGGVGEVSSLIAGKTKLHATAPGGFFVRDATNRDFARITGTLGKAGEKNVLRFHGRSDPLQLTINTTFSAGANGIAIEGVVENLATGDRSVDLKFTLPVDVRGWMWGADLVNEVTIRDKVHGVETGDNITVYPLAVVSNPQLNTGVSLAVPPTNPTLFTTGADAEGLFISFKIGLSDATSPPNRTRFQLILFRHDPLWGFRAALDCYYDLFRDPFFTRKIKRIGAWYWAQPPTSKLKNPQLYAFHEAGSEGAAIVPGTRHEAPAPETNVSDFARRCEFPLDEKLGIYSLPYTIVGQRQIYDLPTMPRDRDEALGVLEKWTTDKPIIFQSNGPANGFRSVEQLKEIIHSSCLFDEQDKPILWLRDYMGNTATFPLNPNPRLFFDFNKTTIAKYSLDDYLPMLFKGSALIDGCYVDSLGRWPGYYNFRREHFKYSTVPLTYHGKPARPCLWNAQSHAEYLQELSRRLHEQGKIVFANGVHPDRVMLGFYVDAMGMEGLPDFHRGDNFYATRVAACTKPYCALNAGDSGKPSVWNSCLFLGILIGSHSEKTRGLEEKYLPTMIQLNEAGWQPITFARTDSKAAIERWGGGDGKPVCFTLLNKSKEAIETTVRADVKALKIGKSSRVTDLISKAAIASTWTSQSLAFKLTLAPETATALQIAK